MSSTRFRSEDLRRALLWGLVALIVVAVAGGVAEESLGTVAAFSIPSGIVVGVCGYFREPPGPKTDADRMSWLFSIVFRGVGRGGR
jgi:hypothetical protein